MKRAIIRLVKHLMRYDFLMRVVLQKNRCLDVKCSLLDQFLDSMNFFFTVSITLFSAQPLSIVNKMNFQTFDLSFFHFNHCT